MAETVPKGQEFRMNAEIEIDNLKELHQVLSQVHEQSFRSHVTDKKNDFAAWVRHSVKDYELADKLERTLDFDETKRIIKERVEELEEKERKEQESIQKQHEFDEKLEEQKDPFTGKDIFGIDLDHLDIPPEPPEEDPYKNTPVEEARNDSKKPLQNNNLDAQTSTDKKDPTKEQFRASSVLDIKDSKASQAKPILPEIPKLSVLQDKPEMHPAERMKHAIRSVIFGFLLGLITGLAIGYILGLNRMLG